MHLFYTCFVFFVPECRNRQTRRSQKPLSFGRVSSSLTSGTSHFNWGSQGWPPAYGAFFYLNQLKPTLFLILQFFSAFFTFNLPDKRLRINSLLPASATFVPVKRKLHYQRQRCISSQCLSSFSN